MNQPINMRTFVIVECIHNMMIVDSESRVGLDGATLWVGCERTYECPKCQFPTGNDQKQGVGLHLFNVLEVA
jgi:hypothetical protein